MLTVHIAAPGVYRIALDRLAGECFAFGLPISQRALLKIEIQRLAVRSRRQHSASRGIICLGKGSGSERPNKGEQIQDHNSHHENSNESLRKHLNLVCLPVSGK
jgi:hypothetical protein